MTEPMFEIEGVLPEPPEQGCDRCAWSRVRATDDQLRVRGWIVYDGPSWTGKDLHVRVCPPCQQKGS